MGTLAEEFAAMPRPRGRASKRAKTATGSKTTKASSPSDAGGGAGNGGGGGVHPSSKISEVRSMVWVQLPPLLQPPPPLCLGL